MRPIHVVAAYSWVTMVPMTSIYYGLKIREAYRGMDHDAVEAIICIGRMPTTEFNMILQIIYSFLNEKSKSEVDTLRATLIETYGDLDNYRDSDFLPPDVLDVDRFAEDYYRSIAITSKRFRMDNELTMDTMAKVLGLSHYQYRILEKEDDPKPFSMSIGVRVKLGFKIDSHVSFTKEMTSYPEFHNLRISQHIRDMLIVESMRHLPKARKKPVINILKELSKAYFESPKF